jgi:hypothetical protein
MQVEIGRDVDYVSLKDGRTVVPIIFCHMGMNSIIEFGPLLKQFQVHQLALDRFRILMVVEPEHRPLLERYIRETFARHLGDFGTLEVEFTERIPVDASGKLKYFVPIPSPDPAGEGP